MINLRFALIGALLIFSSSSNATLLLSEYIEGSSYNKALEIYNAGETVDFSLQNYVVDIYVNGATAPRYSISLTGMLEAQDTYVLAHTSAQPAIVSFADVLTGSLNFNGDDAITLTRDGVVVDRIGQLGVDPGSEWGSGLSSTQNNTLRRNANVMLGENDPWLDFDPLQQWQGFNLDDFSGLGAHDINSVSLEYDAGENVSVPLPGSLSLIAAGLLPLFLNGFLAKGRKFRAKLDLV